MCGFAGFMLLGEDSDLPKIFPGRIRHRGPDEEAEAIGPNFKLNFFRLSINGVANGRQPFSSPQDGIHAVTNGEIYNFAEIRAELMERGHSFTTDSDCEVVLWGYKEWGTNIFRRLKGMFAIAVVDQKRNALLLARDRLGKKPLYARQQGRSVSFSSEVAALWISSDFPTREHAFAYLATDSIPWDDRSEGSIFAIRPGHFMKFTPDRRASVDYWALEKKTKATPMAKNSSDWYVEFADRFRQAVKSRLISEVPIGSFFSGGLDSLAVTGQAAALGGVRKLYHLSFEGKSYDESPRALGFAKNLEIPIEVVSANREDLGRAWEVFKNSVDEPFSDAAVLGQLLLSEAASEKTKVVLTGDGGDELLLGYSHFKAHQVVENRLLSKLAIQGARIAEKWLEGFRDEDKYFSLKFIAHRYLRGAESVDFFTRDLLWRSNAGPKTAADLVTPGHNYQDSETLGRIRSLYFSGLEGAPLEKKWSDFYVRQYLPEVILKKVDRATMRFGVEARSPLLDADLVEWAIAMPSNLKRSFSTDKLPIRHVLKELDLLPKKRVQKHGMGVPLVSLLEGPARNDVEALMSKKAIEEESIFDWGAVRELFLRYREAPSLHAREIWSLLVFNVWQRRMRELSS